MSIMTTESWSSQFSIANELSNFQNNYEETYICLYSSIHDSVVVIDQNIKAIFGCKYALFV